MERENLLRAIVDLYAEAGARRGAGPGAAEAPAGSGTTALGPDDEELVAAVRATLAEIAFAISGDPVPARSPTAAALDGAELMLRMELAAGVRDGLPRLLPGFAYMVTLPSLGEPEAARLAGRVRALTGEGDRGGG